MACAGRSGQHLRADAVRKALEPKPSGSGSRATAL